MKIDNHTEKSPSVGELEKKGASLNVTKNDSYESPFPPKPRIRPVMQYITPFKASSADKPGFFAVSLFYWVKDSIRKLLGCEATLSAKAPARNLLEASSQPKITVLEDSLLLQPKTQGCALNITEGCEKAIKQAALKSGISVHRLKINFMEVQEEVTRKSIGGKFNEIPEILKSHIEKALPGKKAGDPGKTNEKKLKDFMIEFNKGLDITLVQQILQNRSSTLEVNDIKKQQITLEPKSYLNNTSIQGHVTQARDLRLS